MKTIIFNLPAMYGDHHVIAVRQILLALPGVEDVYASSSFQIVQVRFDPAQIDASAITACLNEAGYRGELPLPVHAHRRSTVIYRGNITGFAQPVEQIERAIWPCPGLGPLTEGK